MPRSEQKRKVECSGFEMSIPVAELQLITSLDLMPPHKAGEIVSPYSTPVKGLWDTGATASTITTRLAEKLELPCIGERVITGVGGHFETKEYLAGLVLPNNIVIHEISLLGFVGSGDFDILVGMNIISLGDFLISTFDGMMHFSFQVPSVGGLRLKGIQNAICADGKMMTTDQQTLSRQAKLGRNELCPCGSGKKSKKCDCSK